MPITLSYSDVHLISNISCQLLCRVVPIDDAEAFYVGVILLIHPDRCATGGSARERFVAERRLRERAPQPTVGHAKTLRRGSAATVWNGCEDASLFCLK